MEVKNSTEFPNKIWFSERKRIQFSLAMKILQLVLGLLAFKMSKFLF